MWSSSFSLALATVVSCFRWQMLEKVSGVRHQPSSCQGQRRRQQHHADHLRLGRHVAHRGLCGLRVGAGIDHRSCGGGGGALQGDLLTVRRGIRDAPAKAWPWRRPLACLATRDWPILSSVCSPAWWLERLPRSFFLTRGQRWWTTAEQRTEGVAKRRAARGRPLAMPVALLSPVFTSDLGYELGLNKGPS